MKTKALIFDMDGTLYSNKYLTHAYTEAAYHTLSKFLQIEIKQAKEIVINKRKELAENLGYKPSLTYTLKTLGVSFEFWNRENVRYVNPKSLLKPDKKLKKLLKTLSKRFKLGIVTNNSDVQIQRTLSGLGINDCFDCIFGITESKRVKPDQSLFRTISKKMGVLPEECLSIGDRYHIDLAPAKACGMKIFEVRDVSDLYKLEEWGINGTI